MERRLSRQEASNAVGDIGWRYLLGTLGASVPATSLASATEAATIAVAACEADADGHLRVDVRADRAVLTLQSLDIAGLTGRDTELAQRVSAALRAAGRRTEPDLDAPAPRSVQLLEIAIDAQDIAAIRPFWKAVLGYTDEPGHDPTEPIVDPVAQGPAVWFQQMDRPRPQRNRIHFDMCVPHDEAARRIAVALEAGGRLLSDDRAPAFWVLADIEGNEVCVTTWQGATPSPALRVIPDGPGRAQ